MADLLLEIGTEEIPVAELSSALNQLPGLMEGSLRSLRLKFERLEVFGTPRRLAALVRGLEDRQPDLEELVIGPPWKVAFDPGGNPTKAASGFAKKLGADVGQLVRHETDKGPYVACNRSQKGKPAAEVLPDSLLSVIRGLSFKRSMRWARGSESFVRPIRWLAAVLGSEPLPLEFAGVRADRFTRGHRFLHPEPAQVRKPAEYVEMLRKLSVLADPAERQKAVNTEVERMEKDVGLAIVPDPALIDEVTHLVEWPVGVCGRFDEAFLDVPREVVVTAMRSHQRYFAMEKEGGKLANRFVSIVGTPVRDLAVSEEGNGRVLQARLADAQFFWQEDLKVPLEDWAGRLEDVTFQAKLGSMKDKADRVAKLGVELASLFGADPAVVEKAGRLCKGDLATHMVGEFPELQGVMGREYARAGGLGEEVALAIWEHYKPRGAADELPGTAAGAALSVADRLDTIVGCIGAGLKPKGRGDPFALRRAALGMVRIGIDRKVRLNMEEVVGKAAEMFDPAVRPKVSEVTDFLLERLRSFLGEDASGDVVRAVLQAGGADLDDLASRVRAVTSLQGSEVFAILATAFRRTVNIFKQAKVEVGKLNLDPAKLVEKEEKELHDKLTEVAAEVKGLLARADYTPALERMAALGPFVDVFFDNVRVLDAPEELSKNRLALLTLVDNLFRRIADFKIIASE